MKFLTAGFALSVLLSTAAFADVPLEQLKDPRSSDGLNMAKVEERQREMRSKGVSNDVSMKILGVAQQRAIEKLAVDEKANLLKSMPKDKKGKADVVAKIAALDAKIKVLQETIAGQLHDIQAVLGLTPEQLAKIKGVDHQQKMRDTSRAQSDPRIGHSAMQPPALPPRPHEVP